MSEDELRAELARRREAKRVAQARWRAKQKVDTIPLSRGAGPVPIEEDE